VIKDQPTCGQSHRFENEALVTAVDASVDKITDQLHQAVWFVGKFPDMGDDFQLP
jgi:hypothetical protein